MIISEFELLVKELGEILVCSVIAIFVHNYVQVLLGSVVVAHDELPLTFPWVVDHVNFDFVVVLRDQGPWDGKLELWFPVVSLESKGEFVD